MIYEIETTNQEVLFRSFFSTNQNENPQKDIELVINRKNLSPILSKKWLKISEGEIIIEAQYNQERVNVILISLMVEKKYL